MFFLYIKFKLICLCELLPSNYLHPYKFISRFGRVAKYFKGQSNIFFIGLTSQICITANYKARKSDGCV